MQNCNIAEPKHATKTTKSLGKYCVAGGPNNESCKNNSTTPGISMHEFPKPGNRLRSSWSLSGDIEWQTDSLRLTRACVLHISNNNAFISDLILDWKSAAIPRQNDYWTELVRFQPLTPSNLIEIRI